MLDFHTHDLHTHKQRINPGEPITRHSDAPRFEPIPVPQPVETTLPLAAIIGQAEIGKITERKQIVFHSVGDTGGVHGTEVQEALARQMEKQVQAPSGGAAPSFFYHLGDVIYFNGESYLYHEQFYEPYKYYPAPIFAIPGNHDGDTHTRRGDPPDTDPSSLFGFLQNFCATRRRRIDSYRDTMTQPYPYWVLKAPFVTIIGLYSNIDGLLDGRGAATQEQWLLKQLKEAANDPCLIVAVHHPPFSLDAVHGGYPHILDAIDRCIKSTNVWPHAVLSGHVHNYQRFTRKVGSREIPYIIAGAGGQANTPRRIHRLAGDNPDALIGQSTRIPTDVGGTVALNAYNQKEAGFLRVTVTDQPTRLTLEYFAQPLDRDIPDPPSRRVDSVTVDCKAGRITAGEPVGAERAGGDGKGPKGGRGGQP